MLRSQEVDGFLTNLEPGIGNNAKYQTERRDASHIQDMGNSKTQAFYHSRTLTVLKQHKSNPVQLGKYASACV